MVHALAAIDSVSIAGRVEGNITKTAWKIRAARIVTGKRKINFGL